MCVCRHPVIKCVHSVYVWESLVNLLSIFSFSSVQLEGEKKPIGALYTHCRGHMKITVSVLDKVNSIHEECVVLISSEGFNVSLCSFFYLVLPADVAVFRL